MADAEQEYSFERKRTSYKSEDLVYDEPGRRLVIYLEMSGARGFDLVGVDESFEMWTVPAGEPIGEEGRERILERMRGWGRANNLRIDISPAVTREEEIASLERHGYRILHLPDGSFAAYPPGSAPPVVIQAEEVAGYEARGWTVQAVSGSGDSYVAFAPSREAPPKEGGLLRRIRRWLNGGG